MNINEESRKLSVHYDGPTIWTTQVWICINMNMQNAVRLLMSRQQQNTHARMCINF